MSFHAVAVDPVFQQARETQGPFGTFDAAKAACDEMRARYRELAAPRGSLGRTLADETEFKVIPNAAAAPAAGEAA